MERRDSSQTQATATEKFELIHRLVAQAKNKLKISWLCEIASVSRSGYYNWINSSAKRLQLETKDKEDFELILKAFNHRGYDKGRRGLYMRLLHSGVRMNPKKISRLMKKFGLVCPIRKANPYRRMAKAIQTNSVSDNVVNHEFEAHGPGKILLTDITYLTYGNGKRAYLSTVKDAYTKQILSYVPSPFLTIDFVLKTIHNLMSNHGQSLSADAIIHSDQGCHYTSLQFRELVKQYSLRQSMSRRGNCWDNAPQESFFGHMKDEINLKNCQTFDELKTYIDDYMNYYNTERYQWNLERLSPNQYAEYLKTGIHPLHLTIA